jgi:class 3 adenylate cyclase
MSVLDQLPTLRTAHILFLDIVGFARLRTDQQVAAQKELSVLVQSAPEVAAVRQDAEEFLLRPTGDGMALLFFKDLLSPVRCALQIAETLAQNNYGFGLRMGVHTGPVSLLDDINGNPDAAGDGIIQAQRVMDLGDAGHILLSGDAARVLLKIAPWPQYLRDLGVVRVKHRQELHIYSLYGRLNGPFCGNSAVPGRVQADSRARQQEQRIPLSVRFAPYRRTAILLGLLTATTATAWSVWERNPVQVRAAAATLTARLRPALKPEKKQPARATVASKATTKPARRAAVPTRRATLVPPVRVARVPPLRRLPLEEAVALAESQGFSVIEKGPRVVKPGFEEGTVFFQSLPAGKKATEGARIAVRVAAWPKEKLPAEEPADNDGLADPSSDSAETPLEE